MRIAIDAGHSTVKVWADGGRHDVFPARIVAAPVTMALGQLGGDPGAFTITEDRDEPVTYWIGERAVPLTPPLWTRDKAADPLTRGLVYAACARMGLPDGPIGIGLGLPLAWFKGGKDSLRAAFVGRTVTVAHGARVNSWKVTAVRVLPQGASAALSVFAGGGLSHTGLYVVVDIGYRTTEYVVVEVQGARLVGRPEWSGMMNVGWSLVDDTAARRVSDDTGTTIWAASLTGARVMVNGRALDLAPYRAAGVAQLANRIAQTVESSLVGIWDELQGAIIVGGAAPTVAPQLNWGALPIRVPDQPAMANVQGFWQGVATLPVPLASMRVGGPG